MSNGEESKFIICPSCGAILEKGVHFCGFCGANVEKEMQKKSDYEQQFYRPVQTQQPQVRTQGGFTYSQEYVVSKEDIHREAAIEAKITRAYILSFLAYCFLGVLGIILGIVSLVLISQVKKKAPGDPRIIRARAIAIIAIIGSIISIGIMIYFYSTGFF